MRFEPDHDFHIHTKLSFCSNDPEQSTENILKYGEKNGFKTLCFTDHMWDTARIPTDHHFYKNQTYEYICGSLPLPESDKVKLFFGCETDLNSDMVLGVSPEVMDKLDFIIIAIVVIAVVLSALAFVSFDDASRVIIKQNNKKSSATLPNF